MAFLKTGTGHTLGVASGVSVEKAKKALSAKIEKSKKEKKA